MFLSLGMSQVAVLIMQHQAELAFKGCQVFVHETQDLVDGDGLFLGPVPLGAQIDAGRPQ